MLVMKERQPAIQTIEGWATSVLLETGAIGIACEEPPPGLSQDEAVVAVKAVLNSIGDTCPDCPPDGD